ncbi:MAG: AAA family ATPase [Halomonas subglaciescola]|nr:AAA family ATPase [Halomonas subglaciescola]
MAKPSLSFQHVTLENIGAYFGEHTVDFPSGHRNMMMIHGNNTGGKTSFINGLKWCLFHQISTSHEGLLDPFTLYNRKALAKGSAHPMSVTIEAEYNGQPIIINRTAKWLYDKTRPRSYEEVATGFTITQFDENGSRQPLSEEDSERFIRRIAPPVLGRFFLFDGELLSEYETLVSRSAGSNPKLGEAISGVLGLPVLEKAAGVLQAAKKEADRKNMTLARGESAEGLVERIKGLESNLERCTEECAEIDDQLDALGDSLAAAEAEYKSYAATEADLNQISVLEKHNADLDAEITRNQTTLAKASSNVWHDLAKPTLERQLDSLVSKSDALHQQSQQTLKRDHLEELRRALLDEEDCPVCLQHLKPDARASVKSMLDALDADREVRQQKTDDYEDLIAKRKEVERLSRAMTPIKTEYEMRTERIKEIVSTKARNLSEIDHIKSEANSISPDVIEGARKKVLSLTREQAALEEHKKTALKHQKDLEIEKDEQLSRMQSTIEHDEEAKQVKRVLSRLAHMESVIDQAKNRQAEAMRKKVEEYTSHAYRAMTHETHHAAVKIEPGTFNMTILDDENNPVTRPSSGATQILALALIISLGQIGRKIGPLVMDTPLGRLDPSHRIKVLSYLPQHTHQVVLLYHGGEIDKATYERVAKMGQIGKEYEISKGSAESSSRLVPKQSAAFSGGDDHE